jgi:hypothetical protein
VGFIIKTVMGRAPGHLNHHFESYVWSSGRTR